jgi:hypothetical protein
LISDFRPLTHLQRPWDDDTPFIPSVCGRAEGGSVVCDTITGLRDRWEISSLLLQLKHGREIKGDKLVYHMEGICY